MNRELKIVNEDAIPSEMTSEKALCIVGLFLSKFQGKEDDKSEDGYKFIQGNFKYRQSPIETQKECRELVARKLNLISKSSRNRENGSGSEKFKNETIDHYDPLFHMEGRRKGYDKGVKKVDDLTHSEFPLKDVYNEYKDLDFKAYSNIVDKILKTVWLSDIRDTRDFIGKSYELLEKSFEAAKEKNTNVFNLDIDNYFRQWLLETHGGRWIDQKNWGYQHRNLDVVYEKVSTFPYLPMQIYYLKYLIIQLSKFYEVASELKAINNKKYNNKYFVDIRKDKKEDKQLEHDLRKILPQDQSFNYFKMAIYDEDFLGSGKTLARHKKENLISALNPLIGIKREDSSTKYLYEFFEKIDLCDYKKKTLLGSHNQNLSTVELAIVGDTQDYIKNRSHTIYYGAPGTGKSHKIQEIINDEDGCSYIRCTFHQDYQNSDFIGSLRPAVRNEDPTYEFFPGPFTEAYCKAISNPDTKVFLVIEELNRGNAAAIFGDIFQLLDRDETGKSQYPVSMSNELKQYLQDHLQVEVYSDELLIPSNMTILATMNSSDQNVFHLDTAFKRRWDMEYIPINFDIASGKEYFNEEKITVQDKNISWRDFVETINKKLLDEGIEEDRILGPYFIGPQELKQDDLSDIIRKKVLPYLWNDVLRHGLRSLIFNDQIKSFGELSQKFKKQEQIFKDDLFDKGISE